MFEKVFCHGADSEEDDNDKTGGLE